MDRDILYLYKEIDQHIEISVCAWRKVYIYTLCDKCFFPFYYKNAIHHDCIKFKAKQKWCSLNETYNGYWKYCSEGDFAKCVFPFWYRRMIYWECTNDAETFGKNWCSLTQNYNKEKIWKYCD
uniref:Fibronectin type-II domain-containing protein n=1 Tax=Rhinolophus ferrumequinum TaxID=59479 RepID=A0A671E3Q5_RHIFE